MNTIVQSLAWGLSRLAGPVAYPPETDAPYAPGEAYPELAGQTRPGGQPNPIFAAVREAMHKMGLDADHFGTPAWNPLGMLVKPGGNIVVKPNWVLHKNLGQGGMECMITHPSVLRAVLEYVFLTKPALVVLGDAPLQGCDFERLLDYAGLRAVIAEFQNRGLPLVIKDFRRTILREEGPLKKVAEELRAEDQYEFVDLGADSLLEAISADWKKFRVTMYDPRLMWRHHRPGRHRYLVAKEILNADLVVNVPKLKAHKKAGVTCCLKNLIGINGNKEFLPHHRKGAVSAGKGDNYPNRHWLVTLAEHLLDVINCLRGWPRLYRQGERLVWWFLHFAERKDATTQIEGSWHGNDTIWRTCLDLNRALLFADCAGQMTDTLQRQEISIVDAVITGQGEGPLAPDPLETGAILAAHNPAIGDLVATRLLGFVPEKIALLRHACDDMKWRICAAPPVVPEFTPPFPPARAPKGWAGHIEAPGVLVPPNSDS